MTGASTESSPYRPSLDDITKALARRSFCNLATVSASGRPHVAGVLYEAIGTTLYVNTLRDSRKVRNVADNPNVAVNVPIRRLPVGGPTSCCWR
ncbi:MAG: pyridoxamine 5'-phosphate oxidase family protein [Acidimicrobiales bacterium]